MKKQAAKARALAHREPHTKIISPFSYKNQEKLFTFSLGPSFVSLKLNSKARLYSPRTQSLSNKDKIKKFSYSSRKNLIIKLNQINYDSIFKRGYTAYFITLTYQDFYFKYFVRTMKEVKNQFHKFSIYLRRFFKSNGYQLTFFYKLEFTKKGIPHFHLILFTNAKLDFYADIMDFVSSKWIDIVSFKTPLSLVSNPRVKSAIEKMYRAATNVRILSAKKKRQVFYYVSKYASKPVNIDFDWIGRFWGIVGRDFYKKIIYSFTFHFNTVPSYFKYRRFVLNFFKHRFSPSYYRSFKRKLLKWSIFPGLNVFYISNITPFLQYYLYLRKIEDTS